MQAPRGTVEPTLASRRRPAALGTRSIQDLGLLVAGTALVYTISSHFELHETAARWLIRYERWQLDELWLALTCFTAGAVWFAIRRWREALREIGRRAAAEARVRSLLEHNRELSRRLIDAQETERRSIARELHDELGQSCHAIRVEAACLRGSAVALSETALEGIARIADGADQIHRLVRDLLGRLRPAGLDELGLVPALQELCENWEERSGIACTFHPRGNLDSLGEGADITLYRIVQESLQNVLRHARASSVRVSLDRGETSIRLRITDDGLGYEPGSAGKGLGLLGMRERAEALGGSLSVSRLPAGGSCVEARFLVPLERA